MEALRFTPSLSVLILDGTHVADLSGLVHVRLPHIHTLSIRNSDVADLGPLTQACPGLERLDMGGCKRVKELPPLENLVMLDAIGCYECDRKRSFAKMPKLTWLRLPSSRQMHEALPFTHLAALRNLRTLLFCSSLEEGVADDSIIMLANNVEKEIITLPSYDGRFACIKRAVRSSGFDKKNCYVVASCATFMSSQSSGGSEEYTLLQLNTHGRRWEMRGGVDRSTDDSNDLLCAVKDVDMGIQLTSAETFNEILIIREPRTTMRKTAS